MHSWGDPGVDWKGINDAASYIGSNLRRWGRVNVTQTKEKFGTARVYCSFGFYEVLHGLCNPGYNYYRFPKWLIQVDHFISFRLKTSMLFSKLVIPYQRRLYTYLYGQAIKRWPHLRLEILHGADYPELLKPYGVRVLKTGPTSYEVVYDGVPDTPVSPRRKTLHAKTDLRTP